MLLSLLRTTISRIIAVAQPGQSTQHTSYMLNTCIAWGPNCNASDVTLLLFDSSIHANILTGHLYYGKSKHLLHKVVLDTTNSLFCLDPKYKTAPFFQTYFEEKRNPSYFWVNTVSGWAAERRYCSTPLEPFGLHYCSLFASVLLPTGCQYAILGQATHCPDKFRPD